MLRTIQVRAGQGRRRHLLAALGLVVSALVLFGCSSEGETPASVSGAASPFANVDLANTRQADSSIRAATVSDLDWAWSVPIEARGQVLGGYMASPVVAGGVVYSQDQDSNVQAIDLGNGEVIWEKKYGTPTNGANGVVVADGLVYGATRTDAFALNAKTGKEVWSETLARSEAERILMAPGYRDGLVYFSTRPWAARGGEVGVLWALDGKTGKRVWHFDTVPRGLWGHPKINYGGGLTHAPAFDDEGSMYVGTGNAGPVPGTKRHPWGSSRPGPNLYSSSIVKLDAKTGAVRWHYQVTPHALCNWDIGSPLLARAGRRDIVIAAGLSGIVVALDRETGKPLWRQPVGLHNGHDDDGLLAMRGEYGKLKTPMSVYPGRFGGVFAPISTDGSTVFVPVVDHPTVLTSQAGAEEGRTYTGELVALDVASGAVKWKRRFPSPLYGGVIATNDLVFASTFDGTVRAFDADDGREVWQESMPANVNAGLVLSGDTLLVPAGYPEETQQPEQPQAFGQTPQAQPPEQAPALLAYRLPG